MTPENAATRTTGKSDAGRTETQANSTTSHGNQQRRRQRYAEALGACPSPGGGFHAAMLGVANVAAWAGISPHVVFADLRRVADGGGRRVPDREIHDAIKKGFVEYDPSAAPSARRAAPAIDAAAILDSITRRGAECGEADLWECSPIRLMEEPEHDAALLLATLYQPNEVLFIGGPFDCGKSHIRPVASWRSIKATSHAWPHIIPNPLTGQLGETHDGKPSYRADSCVAAHRYMVIEYDGKPRDWQIQFWAGCPMPVAALIDSGGKSIHGWVRVDADGAEGWQRDVKPLFAQYLKPLGVDGACSNPARLSRIPGHRRKDTRRWQRLLFLDPTARGPRHYLEGGR